MEHQSIISAVDAEIARLKQIRDLLSKGSNIGGVITRRAAKKVAVQQPKKRVMSAEARARIGAAQKKRWAKSRRAAKKAARAVTAPPVQ